MILRKKDLRFFFLLLLSSTFVVADDPPTLDCSPLLLDTLTYDLSSLSEEHSIVYERNTPPTREVNEVRISLCGDLKRLENVPESDQCPAGTRVCLTKTNHKDGSGRVTGVVPIAQTASLAPIYTTLTAPKGVSIVLHGGSYPHPINSTDLPQSVDFKLLCSTTASNPSFSDYDGVQLQIEWFTPAGCGFLGSEEPPSDDKKSPEDSRPHSGGLSSIGWFLLLLVLGFATYMGLGAYYQYSTYGAQGLDLIPHRDFWTELPVLLRDVLCTAVRPRRSSRGGYIAV